MKHSLQRKLLYSYMAVIIIMLIMVSIGVSYLIRDYFIFSKKRELMNKAYELSRVVDDYYQGTINLHQLGIFINSVDSFLDARIWVVDGSRRVIAMSTPQRRYGPGGPWHRPGMRPGGMGIPLEANARGMIRKCLEELNQVFEGREWSTTLRHPFYDEEMLMVSIPVIQANGGMNGIILLNSPVRSINEYMQRIYYYIAAIGLVAVLLTIVIVNWLSRGIVRPLREMQLAAQAMACGDYNRRTGIRTDDEVGELGKSLNSLAQDLERFVSETEKVDKLRRDFVANVSHELRTPLTIIRGYTEALTDGTAADPALQAKYLGMMRDETERLERLIKDLLDLSRLQSQNTNAEMEPIPLAAVAEGVVSIFRRGAEQKGVQLQAEKLEENTVISGNGDRLTQLLLILLDNALKFTPAGGKITVGVERDKNLILLAVSDTGSGIASEDLPFIWERFYKADKAHSRLSVGTGLGLAIAREIIELHGGTVEVASAPAKGTKFIIRFPSLEKELKPV
ncbi:sensor histidine kinase [Acetonema longum]|uniref:histidine kinase n=1 Tax=Acetonema longum DSM 6540 TaxID=1009370 RepID=F7NNJ1_9FIRM|nr:ATP-binding protein [Acetonema longum]EGO62432.1 integral membrane sensor signal transduction histidine kinase [Acetonema longum DSM 6540]